MTRAFALISGLLLATAVVAGADRAVGAADCSVPRELLDDVPKLTVTAERLAAKSRLTIVAIGGASTAGTAAGDGGAHSYPRALEEALHQRHPDLPITVLNKGVPRQTTADMVQRFAQDVYPYDPALVIWETGTVDAVRGNDVDRYTAALQEGIAALRQHNFDIMLVNMQYNPTIGTVINFEPYLEALRDAADLEQVYLFRRFEIMKYWSENGVFDFVDVPKDQRVRLAEDVYQCLGKNMAEAIEFAVQ